MACAPPRDNSAAQLLCHWRSRTNIFNTSDFVLSELDSTLNTAVVQLPEQKELDDGRETLC